MTTESPRQAGPQARVLGKDSAPSAKRRWVPPSTFRHKQDVIVTPESRIDLVFRKVRGILNKLTLEKFQKLSDDLLHTELTSHNILQGVILLIFYKALHEPQYSSMYAQLCKRLCDEAPNFERDGPCTFRLLLLNKCKAEFESRSELLDKHACDPLLDEEERRQLAKRKMLGNIKFIGELGKLEILSESILHRCIQELLCPRRGEVPSEDLECLSQIMRTCGRILDSDKGKKLMDQYFERMSLLADNIDLPPRIRFMLKDVIELRRDSWRPRKSAIVKGPMPIHQIRPVEDDRLNYRTSPNGFGSQRDGAFRPHNNQRSGFEYNKQRGQYKHSQTNTNNQFNTPMFNIINCRALLKELKCKQCSKLLSVLPVYYCSAIGNICGRCISTVDWMISNGTLERAVAYEAVAKFLIFPCANSDNGCQNKLRVEEVEQHEKTCKAIPTPCPFNIQLGLTSLKCEWQGTAANVTSHLHAEHTDCLQVGLPTFVMNVYDTHVKNFFTTIEDQTFLIITKYLKDINKFYFTVMCCSMNPSNHQCYHLQLEIGRYNDYFLVFRKPNLERFGNVQDVINNSENMISVDVTSVLTMLEDPSALIYCKIAICKKSKKKIGEIMGKPEKPTSTPSKTEAKAKPNKASPNQPKNSAPVKPKDNQKQCYFPNASIPQTQPVTRKNKPNLPSMANLNIESNKDLAPRFKKNLIVPHEEDLGELQLRPSMIFNKASMKSSNIMNSRPTETQLQPPASAKQTSASLSLLKEALPIKQASVEKLKQGKKDKSLAKALAHQIPNTPKRTSN